MKTIFQILAFIVVAFIVYIGYLFFTEEPLRAPRPMAEIEACKATLRGVQSSLDLYFKQYKNYPINLEVLIKKEHWPENGYIDGWGNKLKYKPILFKDSKGKAENYLLGSNGPDGKENTDDDIESPIDAAKHSFKQKPAIPSGVKAE